MNNPSRRDLAFLLPALSVAARAQEAQPKAPPQTLTSHSYIFEELPVKPDPAPSQKKTRAVAKGILHNGFGLDIHETELGPGEISHPPHRHVYEEAFVILEGKLEYYCNGTRTILTPGSVGFAGSNDEHGVRNAGDTRCRYCVFELGVGSVGIK